MEHCKLDQLQGLSAWRERVVSAQIFQPMERSMHRLAADCMCTFYLCECHPCKCLTNVVQTHATPSCKLQVDLILYVGGDGTVFEGLQVGMGLLKKSSLCYTLSLGILTLLVISNTWLAKQTGEARSEAACYEDSKCSANKRGTKTATSVQIWREGMELTQLWPGRVTKYSGNTLLSP